MIAHFCVVEDTFVGLNPIVIEHLVSEWIIDLGQRRSYCREIIFRQRPGVGARIGDGFVLLIKGLRNLQCAFRRKAEAIVRFALQGREIIQLRRNLCRRLLFFQLDNPILSSCTCAEWRPQFRDATIAARYGARPKASRLRSQVAAPHPADSTGAGLAVSVFAQFQSRLS